MEVVFPGGSMAVDAERRQRVRKSPSRGVYCITVRPRVGASPACPHAPVVGYWFDLLDRHAHPAAVVHSGAHDAVGALADGFEVAVALGDLVRGADGGIGPMTARLPNKDGTSGGFVGCVQRNVDARWVDWANPLRGTLMRTTELSGGNRRAVQETQTPFHIGDVHLHPRGSYEVV